MAYIWEEHMKNNLDTQLNFNNLLSWFLCKKSKILDREGEWAVDMVARSLASQFLALKKVKEKKSKKKFVNIKIINDKYFNKIDKSFLYNLKKLQTETKKLNPFIQNFLIHGSFATLDYKKGWSDLDTLIIIKGKIFLDIEKIKLFRKKILYLEKYLYKIDVLQHHGFIFITDLDLKKYHSSYLPIEVMEKSVSLTKNEVIKINYSRDKNFWKKKLKSIHALFYKSYKKGILFHHPLNGIFLKDNFKNVNTMYQMKYFLSLIMGIPFIYLETIGKPSYKKESFITFKNILKINDEIIRKASLIRNSWPKNEKYPYKGNKIPKWVINILGRDYFKRAFKLVDQIIKSNK